MSRRVWFVLCVCIPLILILGLAGCGGSSYSNCGEQSDEVIQYNLDCLTSLAIVENEGESAVNARMLSILHLTHGEFLDSIANPRIFPNQPEGRIMAGVVPHHNTAAVLISGFFAQAAAYADYYDLVIILAPNHEGDIANVVLSYRDWDVGNGVFTCRIFVNDIMAADGINTAISHYRMERDHAASILIPYIYHYLPGVEVAPLLLNRTLTFNETIELFHWANNWIYESNKNVLLVASIDFSHFLTAPQSRQMDVITKEAVLAHDLRRIHMMNYHNLDSSAAMIIFLMYLEGLGIEPQIIAHTDASEFLGPGLDETTSYIIIIGVESEICR